ncbi:NitT/TauT family transport system permease protein [Motilibacter rhizosphaerae]|uniref:NitT/TauT family transport system permease protein n=1 Tax=Motilibacter rhizosphaerae TaxID=598652 RepID=A0A4Q7NG68_9ACTN|nr:ABC transporter permease [Motilibacter rhizosphaerae]RZS82799.1 NitT/TauT family transport system permease protein [Motilibacter rhizosphaerae]
MASTLAPAQQAVAAPAAAVPTAVERRRPRAGGAVRAARTLLLRSSAIVIFLAVWEIVPRVGLADRALFPPFSDDVDAWWHLARNGMLWSNTSASLKRSLAGFVIAVGIGVPLGLLIAWYRPVRHFLLPLLELWRNTAALALLPVFTLFLGIGETSKIAIVFYACLFPVLLNTISGVGEVDPLLVKSARSLGFSSLQLFRKVVLPAAVPSIFTGVRMAGASSILVLLAAEMGGAKAGLGYDIIRTQQNFEIPNMYAGIITIALLGVLINAALVRLERRASRWRDDFRR